MLPSLKNSSTGFGTYMDYFRTGKQKNKLSAKLGNKRKLFKSFSQGAKVEMLGPSVERVIVLWASCYKLI